MQSEVLDFGSGEKLDRSTQFHKKSSDSILTNENLGIYSHRSDLSETDHPQRSFQDDRIVLRISTSTVMITLHVEPA